jgi:N-acetyl-anhydromuramyl-L-alanine amidase AmpD
MPLDLSKIKQVPLKDSEYFNEKAEKRQIVLHHTAGNSSGVNTINNWNTDGRGRIATCVCISGKGAKNSADGEIVQAFSSRAWAYHLGLKQEVFKAFKVPYQSLDKISIGIEICAWGCLTKKGEKYYNYVNREVPLDEVCILDEPYKGFKHYHKYTDAQIESVRQLLLYWNEVYGIPLDYNEDDMWDLSKNAISGEKGLFTHNSYRKDKTDVFPQPELIQMLKSLK